MHWDISLNSKSNGTNFIISFHKMIQTQFKANIKSIRSDNGQEFAMTNFYSTHGIIHQRATFTLPNRTLWWRESTSIFCLLLEHPKSNPMYLYTIWGIAFLLQLILSTDYHLPFYIISLPLNSFFMFNHPMII